MNIKGRAETIRYHEELYASAKLNERGSWLRNPSKYILSSLEYLEKKEEICVLDLGAGVGRHAIPIAKDIKSCSVIGVDILQLAIEKMKENANASGVSEKIKGICSDIADYKIEKEKYDLILSCSCIEHIGSWGSFKRVIENVKEGTKTGGVNCFMITTDVVQRDKFTDVLLEPLVEQNLDSLATTKLLKEAYADWNTCDLSDKDWQVTESRDNTKIDFSCKCIQFTAKKP